MPPAISDDESDDLNVPDMIPAKGKAKADPEPVAEEEEDEDDEGEDEYRVEKILKHDFAKDGSALYQIKWLGYEDENDLTWEPIENLDGAKDVLKEYHEKIGGTPEPPAKGSSKKASAKAKRSASAAFDSPAPASSKKRSRASNGLSAAEQKRELPVGSWDDHVLCVTSIVEEAVPVAGKKAGVLQEKKELLGLLQWKDNRPKTQHKLKVLRQKAPQRLLDYYEQHLVFTQPEDTFGDAIDKNGEPESPSRS